MEQQFPRDIASATGILALTDEFLARERIGPRAALAVRLAVDELFTNLIQHNRGGGDHVRVGLGHRPGRVTVRLTDYEVESFAEPRPTPVDVEAPVADRTDRGLGLHLVHNLVEDLRYEFEDHVLQVTVVINLEEPVFDIQRNRDGDLVLTGKLEASEADKARAALEQVEQSCDLDFAGLDYISSAGLGVLIEAQRRLAGSGQALRFKNVDPYMRELFEIAGFHHIFEME